MTVYVMVSMSEDNTYYVTKVFSSEEKALDWVLADVEDDLNEYYDDEERKQIITDIVDDLTSFGTYEFRNGYRYYLDEVEIDK